MISVVDLCPAAAAAVGVVVMFSDGWLYPLHRMVVLYTVTKKQNFNFHKHFMKLIYRQTMALCDKLKIIAVLIVSQNFLTV